MKKAVKGAYESGCAGGPEEFQGTTVSVTYAYSVAQEEMGPLNLVNGVHAVERRQAWKGSQFPW